MAGCEDVLVRAESRPDWKAGQQLSPGGTAGRCAWNPQAVAVTWPPAAVSMRCGSCTDVGLKVGGARLAEASRAVLCLMNRALMWA